MNGYLKIKTKIDNKEVDKGIAELENKIKKLQTDNSSQSKQVSALQKEIDDYEELQNQAEEYRQKLKQLNAERKNAVKNNPSFAVTQGTPEFQNINAQIAEMQSKYAQATNQIDKQAPKIDKVYAKLDKIKAKQTENNAKISQFKQKIDQIKLNKIQSGLNSVGKNLQNQIGKIGKMAMAVVGIRTAWFAVRRAVNLVSQYNPGIATDFQYMGYCVANILVPAVQSLVKLLYTVLSYINAIASAWFGINLFGNSSVKNFKKMQNSASGTAKSAKEIQKSLQGFDEMNVLQDSTSSSSGSGGGVTTPSMDLSSIQGDIPAWLKWIIDNKDVIFATFAGIATGIAGLKLLEFLANLGLIENKLLGIKASGIGIAIAGIVITIQNLIKYLKDPTWGNFGGIIQGVGVAIMGLAVLIGSIPTAVAGAIVLIVGTIVKYWEQIKAFFQGGIDWLVGKSDWVHNMFGDIVGRIYDTIVDALQLVLNIFDNVFTAIRGVFDGLIMFITGVFSGDWKKAWEGIKKIFSSIWEGLKGIVTSVWNFIKNLVVNIAKSVGDVISGVFKAVVNAVLGAIESILNTPIRAINGLIGVINKVPGINLGRLSTFSLPRLAKGGIISQPTQAIIGEAGREAVVPLENNLEWLDILADKLASKIGSNGGSYIIQMNGRTIQRGIAKVRQELAFETNGR